MLKCTCIFTWNQINIATIWPICCFLSICSLRTGWDNFLNIFAIETTDWTVSHMVRHVTPYVVLVWTQMLCINAGGSSWDAGGSPRCLMRGNCLSWISHVFKFHCLFLKRDTSSSKLLHTGRFCLNQVLLICWDSHVTVWMTGFRVRTASKATNFWNCCFALENLHWHVEAFKTLLTLLISEKYLTSPMST